MESNEPTAPTNSLEPSQELSQEQIDTANPVPQTQPFNRDVSVHKQTVKMLKDFREGVKQGTYRGDLLIGIAMGVQFLDGMVANAEGQMQYAIRLQKEDIEKARQEAKTKLQVLGAEKINAQA